MLISGLRVLLGTLSMFFALGMIAPAVVFSGGAVCLRCIFMMFGSLVVFVLSHSLSYERPRQGQSVGGSLPLQPTTSNGGTLLTFAHVLISKSVALIAMMFPNEKKVCASSQSLFLERLRNEAAVCRR